MLSGVFNSLSFAAIMSGASSSAETAYCLVQIAWSAQSFRMFVFREIVVSFMMVAEYQSLSSLIYPPAQPPTTLALRFRREAQILRRTRATLPSADVRGTPHWK